MSTDRRVCLHCGQTFRKNGNGLEWHLKQRHRGESVEQVRRNITAWSEARDLAVTSGDRSVARTFQDGITHQKQELLRLYEEHA